MADSSSGLGFLVLSQKTRVRILHPSSTDYILIPLFLRKCGGHYKPTNYAGYSSGSEASLSSLSDGVSTRTGDYGKPK